MKFFHSMCHLIFQVDFKWTVHTDNETKELTDFTPVDSSQSYLKLDDDYSNKRVYRCIANNSVGIGECSIEVTGKSEYNYSNVTK